jgi:hypothetical protein
MPTHEEDLGDLPKFKPSKYFKICEAKENSRLAMQYRLYTKEENLPCTFIFRHLVQIYNNIMRIGWTVNRKFSITICFNIVYGEEVAGLKFTTPKTKLKKADDEDYLNKVISCVETLLYNEHKPVLPNILYIEITLCE